MAFSDSAFLFLSHGSHPGDKVESAASAQRRAAVLQPALLCLGRAGLHVAHAHRL